MSDKVAEKEAIEKEELEESQYLEYMEDLGEDEPSDSEEKEFHREVIKTARKEFKNLILNRRQAKRIDNKELIDRIDKALRQSYKVRRDSVIQLRNLGEEVKDRTIPMSAMK